LNKSVVHWNIEHIGSRRKVGCGSADAHLRRKNGYEKRKREVNGADNKWMPDSFQGTRRWRILYI